MNARDRVVAEIASADVETRLASADWTELAKGLDDRGSAVIEHLLTPAQCDSLAALYADDDRFRSRVVMERHGFGRGEYRYFRYPLPALVAGLRTALYPRLAPVANRWNAALGIDARYPARHPAFIARCHAAGQTKPTPLLLRYGAGDYNCLHQDLYGEHVVSAAGDDPAVRAGDGTSPAASSCSPSSGRACSRDRKS